MSIEDEFDKAWCIWTTWHEKIGERGPFTRWQTWRDDIAYYHQRGMDFDDLMWALDIAMRRYGVTTDRKWAYFRGICLLEIAEKGLPDNPEFDVDGDGQG